MVKVKMNKKTHLGLKVDHSKSKTDFLQEKHHVLTTTTKESRKYTDISNETETKTCYKTPHILRSNSHKRK